VSGIILKRNFVEGSDVEAGQSLYQIDPATYQAAWNSAKGDEAKAEAAAAIAHLTVKRYVPLLGTKYISQQEYDQAVATARQADADVIATKAAVETARINLAYTKVTSPLAGASVNRASPKGRWSPTASRMPWLPSSSSIPSMST
jgi:multidrug efflux system membrane fusion protein